MIEGIRQGAKRLSSRRRCIGRAAAAAAAAARTARNALHAAAVSSLVLPLIRAISTIRTSSAWSLSSCWAPCYRYTQVEAGGGRRQIKLGTSLFCASTSRVGEGRRKLFTCMLRGQRMRMYVATRPACGHLKDITARGVVHAPSRTATRDDLPDCCQPHELRAAPPPLARRQALHCMKHDALPQPPCMVHLLVGGHGGAPPEATLPCMRAATAARFHCALSNEKKTKRPLKGLQKRRVL